MHKAVCVDLKLELEDVCGSQYKQHLLCKFTTIYGTHLNFTILNFCGVAGSLLSLLDDKTTTSLFWGEGGSLPEDTTTGSNPYRRTT